MNLAFQVLQWFLCGTAGLVAFTTVMFFASEVIDWTLYFLQRLFGPRQ